MPNVALPYRIPGATTEFVAPATRSHKIKNVSSFLFHAVEMAAPLRGLLDGGPQCGPQHPQRPQRPSVCTIIFARTDPNQVPDYKMERKGANEEISYEDLEG